jgi:hypothetical protein
MIRIFLALLLTLCCQLDAHAIFHYAYSADDTFAGSFDDSADQPVGTYEVTSAPEFAWYTWNAGSSDWDVQPTPSNFFNELFLISPSNNGLGKLQYSDNTANNTTLILPDLNGTDTFAAVGATQVLTNKELTAAKVTGASSGKATLQYDSSATNSLITIPALGDTTLVGTDIAQTLSFKTLVTPNIAGGGSNFVTLQYVSSSNPSTFEFPDVNGTDTVVGVAATQSLTNKTLTAPTIVSGLVVGGNTLTLPSSADTLVGRATTDSLSNKTLVGPYIWGPGAGTAQLQYVNTATGHIFSIPDPGGDDTFVTLTASQTLTNKTLTSPVIGTISNTGTLTLPTSTDTLVGKATTDTLTNKTLTNPKIGTAILDTGGNELFLLTATSSAVNELTYANAATGNPPTFTASGGDTDISIQFTSKGAGTVNFTNSNGITIKGAGAGSSTLTYVNTGTNRGHALPNVGGTIVVHGGLTATGGIVYTTNTNGGVGGTAAGTSGQGVLSGGTGAPTFAHVLNGSSTTTTGSGTVTLSSTSNPIVIADATSNNVTYTLPAATNKMVFWFIRKDNSGNTVTINRAGSDTITDTAAATAGNTSFTLAAYKSVEAVADGTSIWYTK